MLTEEEILKNKESFLSLIRSIERDGADIEGLITKLEHSDFFYAPASTKYHCAFEGGLCYHSLNVYKKLVDLCQLTNTSISPTSIIIISLLHDLSKMNFYETVLRNTKNEFGEWVKVPYIQVKNAKDRFIFGNHEQNSLYMIETFIPLTLAESVAILHHHAGMSWDCAQDNVGDVFNKYPLALLLHTADMFATYIDENE